MTKLELLLKELDAANHDPHNKDRYEKAKSNLAWWVYRLWRKGRLDASVTLRGETK